MAELPDIRAHLSVNRRRFLQGCAMGAGAILLDWPAWAGTEAAGIHRWFPAFPAPREVWVLPSADDVEEGMILESAAGLAALAALQSKSEILIYEDIRNDGYQRWFAQDRDVHRPRVTRMSLDEVIEGLLRANIVRGYLLYRFEQSSRGLHSSSGKLDESANVATALASKHGGVMVSERMTERMRKLGLKQLLDLRERNEEWCLSQHDFSRRVLGTADPKTRHARSLMIALEAFVCSGRGDVYRKALARCEEDSPVLGWGCDAEDGQTSTSSRWGFFQTSTNWCHNLPLFSSDVPGESIPAEDLRQRPLHWSALDWGDGIHHVNFTLSDGDNVQWVMGNFTGGNEASYYYGNPNRGRIPFAWGLPVPSLCQLSPRTLVEILSKATPNDDFIQFHAGGYFYPDLYGKERRSTKAIELHAERLKAYMDLTGIRVLAFNFQDWDSAEARAACKIFASKLPGLLGILAFQYYPYSAGDGAIHWMKGLDGDEVPVVSCRLTLWAQTGRPRDTTPAGVAACLNGLPVAGDKTTVDCFSWVIAHAWSRFRPVAKGAPLDAEEKDVAQDKDAPGTARGYEPVLWAAERLKPAVKPVTIQELLLRVRLRLRPRTTLSRCLTEVESATNPATSSPESAAKLAEARSLLAKADDVPAAARRCFELLQGVYRSR